MSLREHEPWITGLIPFSGDTAVDVGASHGIWTFALAGMFRLVLAFEPHPSSYAELTQRARHDPGNIRVWNCALGATAGQERLMLFQNPDHTSSTPSNRFKALRSEPLDGGQISVPRMPLDYATTGLHEKIDFIKIDVEGAEVEVLEGAKELMDLRRATWIVECHSNDALFACQELLSGYKQLIVTHPDPDAGEHGWLRAAPIQ